jgi:hypothetical protein
MISLTGAYKGLSRTRLAISMIPLRAAAHRSEIDFMEKDSQS